MNRIYEKSRENILIAAHRGANGGNIVGNTIESFECALLQGADILEMDIFQSADGELYVFHTELEPLLLHTNKSVCDMDSSEIDKLRYYNSHDFITEWKINKFDDVLDCFKGRAILNLDRCWDILGPVIRCVEKHNMKEDILLKSPPDKKHFKMIEEIAPDYMYMPILTNSDDCTDILIGMIINFVGAECSFATEDAYIVSDEFITKMKINKKVLWSNAIVYSYQHPLSAGHSDDVSVAGKQDDGWGWLIDKGFDIIQTDWTGLLKQYLISRKSRERQKTNHGGV